MRSSICQLHDELFQQLRDTTAAPGTLEQLGEHWQQDPAVQARLIAAANSSLYNSTGQPCVSLPDAVRRLGAATALNLIQGLALRPAASLQDADLRTLGQNLMQTQLDLRHKVGALAKACQLDPAPCIALPCYNAWASWPCCSRRRSGATAVCR